MSINSAKQISVFQYKGLNSDDNFVELIPYDIENHMQVHQENNESEGSIKFKIKNSKFKNLNSKFKI